MTPRSGCAIRYRPGIGVAVAGATGRPLAWRSTKRDQLAAAREAGFNIPETEYINENQEILKIDRLPVVIKPVAAVAEKDGKLHKGPIFFCLDRGDLDGAATIVVMMDP